MDQPMRRQRATLFIDGNNWYHFCGEVGVKNPLDLSYAKISRKLILDREWVETRYYIGALRQDTGRERYAAQRTFLDRITNEDRRITRHLGRIETRPHPNLATPKILEYVNNPATKMPDETREFFRRLLDYYKTINVEKEKAVDVMLARDVIVGAIRNEYDAAYLLSADGDFTPVVETARSLNKTVICASPGYSSELAKAASAFIPLRRNWFDDCYR